METVKDFRPIGLTPILSKVLEKPANSSILHFFEYNCIIPVCHPGFRKRHNTSTSLLNVVDDILAASNENCASILILLHYNRAFD